MDAVDNGPRLGGALLFIGELKILTIHLKYNYFQFFKLKIHMRNL